MRRLAVLVLCLNAIFAWVFFCLHFGLASAWDVPPRPEYYFPLVVLGIVASLAAWQSRRGHTKVSVFVYYIFNMAAITTMVWYDSQEATEIPDILLFLHLGTFFVGLFCGPELGGLYAATTAGIFVWSAIEYNVRGDLVLNLIFVFIAFGASWDRLRMRWRVIYLENRVETLEVKNKRLTGETGELRGHLSELDKLAEVCLARNEAGAGTD